MTTGSIYVSVNAGHIKAANLPPHEIIGQQVRMGDDLYFHITPDVARQWIGVLTTVAEGK